MKTRDKNDDNDFCVKINRFSLEKCKKIHAASLEILDRIGTRLHFEEAMLNYTTKPIIFVSYDFSGCLDCVKMAEAVMGGAEALRRNPIAACYINVPSGLLHNEDSLRKLSRSFRRI